MAKGNKVDEKEATEATKTEEKKEAAPVEGAAAEGQSQPAAEAQSVDAGQAVDPGSSGAFSNGVPATNLVLPDTVSPEIFERCRELFETLETFDKPKLPMVRFKDDFVIREGEHIKEFEGVIIYTKQSNVYYKGKYKPGQTAAPDCSSSDGRKPQGATQQAASCAVCPHNVFGSGEGGSGKACKNTRPVFVLTYNEEGGISVIPKILRIPPTSLPLINSYFMGLAADYGAYYSVKTRFEVFKKDEAQTHFNIKFKTAGRLDKQSKIDVVGIRKVWMTMMETEIFAPDEDEHTSAPAGSPAPQGTASDAPPITDESF